MIMELLVLFFFSVIVKYYVLWNQSCKLSRAFASRTICHRSAHTNKQGNRSSKINLRQECVGSKSTASMCKYSYYVFVIGINTTVHVVVSFQTWM